MDPRMIMDIMLVVIVERHTKVSVANLKKEQQLLLNKMELQDKVGERKLLSSIFISWWPPNPKRNEKEKENVATVVIAVILNHHRVKTLDHGGAECQELNRCI